MALSAIALVSVEEVREVLGINDNSQDTKIERAIDEASAMIETEFCGGRTLKKRTFTDLRVEGPCQRRELYPDAWPIDVSGTIAISVNGTAQTVWTEEADGDPATFDVMAFSDHFFRRAGWAPYSGIRRNVVLTYDGGYDPVPKDLRSATVRFIRRRWGQRFQQMPDLASVTGAGGGFTAMDAGREISDASEWAEISRVFEFYRSRRVY